MCGITGIINYNREKQVDEKQLIEMRDIMRHRGPDACGLYTSGSVGLGHRRLSIIDIGRGRQPMSNEDDTVWIVYNGEIYNYLELRAILISRGHSFKTHSDTEVILHAYEEFGSDCLSHLRGMFAFAIWDDKKRELFGARDRMGIKPFYYSSLKDRFLFASELKALLIDPDVKRELNTEALYSYLSLRYVPGPETMFKNIWKLQPGHYILIKGDRIDIQPYWDITEIPPSDHQSITKIEEEFENMVRECVQMRLMSEVPLGVFLSGGLDSSYVVALMSQVSDQRIKTFSVGYEQDFGTNEFDYARMVAQQYQTDHYEVPISMKDFYDFVPRLVWHLDEPVSDAATIPLFFLSEFAKQHVTVVLSGEGADEILAGYSIYKKMLKMEMFRKLPKLVRENFILNLLNIVFKKEKYRKYIELAKLPLQQRYKGVSRAFMPSMIERLLGGTMQMNGLDRMNSCFSDYYEQVKGKDPLTQMLHIDMKTWLPDDLLIKADKMTMAASQELRVPFLDHKLAEFAFSLPSETKILGNTTKKLLKKIALKVLPDAVVNREKKGFPVPIQSWFKGELSTFSKDVLLDSSSVCTRYFDKNFISEMIDDHQANVQDYSDCIWNLIVFEFWHGRFMGSEPFHS